MAPTTKAELMAAVAVYDLRITQGAARIAGGISESEWREIIGELIQLRESRDILQAQLAAAE
jgi:hypothetical protein